MNIKVALKQAVLQGSNHSEMLQRIAVVYIDAKGYTVYAPPAATGNAVEWFDHWHVHHPGDGFGEVDVTHDALGVLAKRETLEVLKNTTREAIQKTGKHQMAGIRWLRYASKAMSDAAMGTRLRLVSIASSAARRALMNARGAKTQF